MITKLALALLLLSSITLANVVWFTTDKDGETCAKITGRTNSGQDVNEFIAFYNGRYYDLEPGRYFIHVRHPNIHHSLAFAPVTQEYMVKDPQDKGVATKIITVTYPITTTEFKVANAEENVKVTVPEPVIVKERVINFEYYTTREGK